VRTHRHRCCRDAVASMDLLFGARLLDMSSTLDWKI
jgi:hypothetical protein